jgi:aryl-alcohol dehydrogenase-like predicted oxidoreductase
MDYINLGKSGLKVSRLCLGCMTYGDPAWRAWVLPQEQALPFLGKALDAGITFYDTANVYSLGKSEEILGNWLKSLGSARRDQLVIATKVHGQMRKDDPNGRGLSRKHILEQIDASLQRLQTDYIDLYQIHRHDPHTPIEETLETLNDVVRAGKARYLGASSMYAWQFAKHLHTQEMHGWTKFVSMQNHHNLAYREEEREMNPLCIDQGIGLIPWSPLARGFLAGNRSRNPKEGPTLRSKTDPFGEELYYRPEDFAVVDRLTEVAKEKGVPNLQLALAWLLHKPGVTAPIIGTSKPHHLDDALAALKIRLTAEDMKRLEEPYKPHPVLGHN